MQQSIDNPAGRSTVPIRVNSPRKLRIVCFLVKETLDTRNDRLGMRSY